MFSCYLDWELKPSEIMIELITSNNDIEHPKNWLSERAEVVCIPTTKISGTTLNSRTLT